MPQTIKKDKIEAFLKDCEPLIDSQREAMHKVNEIINKECPRNKNVENAIKLNAVKELDATSQKLRLELQKARMIIKYQNDDQKWLLAECNRAWSVAQEPGYQPEIVD